MQIQPTIFRLKSTCFPIPFQKVYTKTNPVPQNTLKKEKEMHTRVLLNYRCRRDGVGPGRNDDRSRISPTAKYAAVRHYYFLIMGIEWCRDCLPQH